MVRRGAAFSWPSPSASACRSTPSASARASRTLNHSTRGTSPAPLPELPEKMTPQPETQTEKDSEQSVAAKLLIELGPLLIFFGVNAAYGIFAGTGAFMVATVISLAVAWWLYHKIP